MAAFKVKIAGREFVFQSEDDFARAVAAMERVSEVPERNGKQQSRSAAPKGYDPMHGTLGFLEELVHHPEGMHSTVAANALKCEPRGIGRRLLDVDEVLKPLGFKREKVYDHSKRVAEGGRIYMPGPDAAAALEAVKRKAGSG
jgi:hypothetical protein